VGYDSLDSFYAAHPDIRAYASVRCQIAMGDASMPPAGIGGVIAQRIALDREQPTG
jgi:hypothetical protein